MHRVSSKISRSLKDLIFFTYSSELTHILVLARNKGSPVTAINYSKKGIPLNGYVYDAVSEKFHCECSDYLDLGSIPISFFINVDRINWQCMIPIPESVLMIFLNNTQKKKLNNFKLKNGEADFDYLQIMGCN